MVWNFLVGNGGDQSGRWSATGSPKAIANAKLDLGDSVTLSSCLNVESFREAAKRAAGGGLDLS